MSQKFIAVCVVAVCFAFAAVPAHADSISARGSDIFFDGHFTTSCGSSCGVSSEFFSRSPLSFELSRGDDRNLIDQFGLGGLERQFDNQARVHGRFRSFDPESFPRAREGSPSDVVVPEPNSLLLVSVGFIGLALVGGSLRRKPPVPPGAV
jgi:hypothetical protein